MPDLALIDVCLATPVLAADAWPACLRSLPASANEIPFGDDRFNVGAAWGSLEHMPVTARRSCSPVPSSIWRWASSACRPGTAGPDS